MTLLENKNPGFLIAMPEMQDPTFKKSVSLILLHDQEGAMGLTLNHALNLKLRDFAIDTQSQIIEENFSKNLFQGGPVGLEQAWIVHEDEKILEKEEIVPGLYLSLSLESLSQILSQNKKRFKIFLGYAGWGSSQLETEMSHGAWLNSEIDLDMVFSEEENLWEKAIKKMGIDPSQLISTSGIQ